jgi:hypothetical protein
MWSTQEGRKRDRALKRIAEDLRQNPVVLPDGEQVRLTFSGGTCRRETGDQAEGGNTIVYFD